MELQRYTETLSRDAREVARARRLVATTLHDWDIEIDVSVMEIMVSELVTNALVHGDGPIDLRMVGDEDRVRLEVVDRGGTATKPHLAKRRSLGGWGLHLVDRLADRWGAEVEAHATRVWTELRPRSLAVRAV